ncbi:uncharacterized protein LOC123509721 [Portunus trituberculatus]|uniref:uncharacterized protein LOC123509721 n=1 Tax=Portunus trituberculatus TaxID=210409 RepID=UPI001E1CECE7|nr:uncharacterized protein LOC123509721 [Portunus trituberculatus]XP_045120170.1 uncharacterized protein LOC123509721 [Portunus trituberculatus]
MSRHAASPTFLLTQSVAAAVAVVVAFAPLFAVCLQVGGGADENHFAMFPGKATWGPSPLAGGSLAAGTGSPFAKVLSLLRPRDTKVASSSFAVKEVKVGFPPLSTEPQPLPRPQPRPRPNPASAGYTVAASPLTSSGPLVMLRGGINGDSPFVLTRLRTDRSRVTKRLN